jgi:hypothetical protein
MASFKFTPEEYADINRSLSRAWLVLGVLICSNLYDLEITIDDEEAQSFPHGHGWSHTNCVGACRHIGEDAMYLALKLSNDIPQLHALCEKWKKESATEASHG